ncbi:RDD family protein [Streptomyces sp. NPDC088354]|uniref:RDD family protein n=1 Tax=Streptomyces sp. NPDC088354 TaxID=3365856 RepID=UPI0037F43FF1
MSGAIGRSGAAGGGAPYEAGAAGRLVTGEAVELGLQPARLPSRALAAALDAVVYFGGYMVVSLGLLAATSSLDDAALAAVYVASLVLVLFGVPIAVETLSRGRSLGKLACGLRVVRDDGGPIRFRHALVRGAVGVVEIQAFLGVIACVASLVSARGRRVGDVFAGTLVVRERIPVLRAPQAMPPAPPWLADRVAGADLSAVPEGLWLAVRQYLARMHQLDPQVGWSMAGRLAADVAACTGTPVPQGTPAVAYLAAVVGERQAREARRVFGAAGFAHAGPPAQGWGAPGEEVAAVPLTPAAGSPGSPVRPVPPSAPPAPAASPVPPAPPVLPVPPSTGQSSGFAPPA